MAGYDLVVAGAGIVGLAHALAGARRGLRVAVIERDSQAASASVRNFGFVTVSGQDAGITRERALRSREVWAEVAIAAGIDVLQRGAIVIAHRPEALEVLEQFAAGEMGLGCEIQSGDETCRQLPWVVPGIAGSLTSPHEIRVEAREALPKLARWLEERLGVTFLWGTPVLGIDGNSVRHAGGSLEAGAVVVAPGAAVASFSPDLARRVELRHCKLQMMRLAPPSADFRLPCVVMSDLSLIRYGGFAAQPAAAHLEAILRHECPEQLAAGVHLIVAQGADGSLVVGDSHHYADFADPFSSDAVDDLILAELHALFELPALKVVERWVGHYPVANVKPLLREAVDRVRLVCVTSGTGMSTAFAIAEETIAELF